MNIIRGPINGEGRGLREEGYPTVTKVSFMLVGTDHSSIHVRMETIIKGGGLESPNHHVFLIKRVEIN